MIKLPNAPTIIKVLLLHQSIPSRFREKIINIPCCRCYKYDQKQWNTKKQATREAEKNCQPRRQPQRKRRAKKRRSEGRLRATRNTDSRARNTTKRKRKPARNHGDNPNEKQYESDAARDQTTSESRKHRVHPQETIALRDLTIHPV